MLFKNSCIASIIAISGLLTIPNMAQAKDIESYQDYRDYCSPAAYQYGIQSSDCDRYRNIYEQRYLQQTNPQQPRRRNVESEKNENDNEKGVSGYVGTTLGLFFPNEDFVNTGFGGNLYVGAKFNRYFATDLESVSIFGSTDYDDNYWARGLFLNPRFILPFDNKADSSSLYISPGIGISQAVSIDDGYIYTDDVHFTWQIKGGLTFPLIRNLDLFGQLRYVSQTADDTVDFFGTEIGIDFQF